MIPNYFETKDPRPLFYLDQNVIDRISKGFAQGLVDAFSSTCRAVYSDITLDEIIRAEEGKSGSANRFLEVLSQLEAYYVKPAFDERMSPLDSLQIDLREPLVVYEEYKNNTQFKDIMEAMTLVPRKLVGGRIDQPIESIGEELRRSFKGLEETIHNNISKLEKIEPRVKELLYGFYENGQALNKVSTQSFDALVERMLTSLEPQLTISSPQESAMQTFRESLKLTPVQLNNLEPPNIVPKIWGILSKDPNIINSGMTLDEYFGLDGRCSVFPDRKPFKSELAIAVYNQLNYCGYYPDKKLHKDENFTSSYSDMTHVSRASYCDALISGDERLVKKAAATYEYLGLATQVIHITYDD